MRQQFTLTALFIGCSDALLARDAALSSGSQDDLARLYAQVFGRIGVAGFEDGELQSDTSSMPRMLREFTSSGSWKTREALSPFMNFTNMQRLLKYSRTHMDAHKKDIENNETEWPRLETDSAWSLGLRDVQVYVLSMPKNTARRKRFAKDFRNASFGQDMRRARWFPGVDGMKVPGELVNPMRGSAHGSELYFETHRREFGCFFSHLLIYLDAHERCPECDVLIFEDDFHFNPDFRNLYANFKTGLPEELPVEANSESLTQPIALYHLAGDAFWTEPLREAKSYYQVGWASRTWAYVIKADKLTVVLEHARQADNADNNGLDQIISGDHLPFIVVAPKVPLGLACGFDSDIAREVVPCRAWSQVEWVKTYEPWYQAAYR